MAVTRLQTQQKTKSEDIGVGGSLLVAALAGCGNVLLTTPIWTVATRMQVHQLLYACSIHQHLSAHALACVDCPVTPYDVMCR